MYVQLLLQDKGPAHTLRSKMGFTSKRSHRIKLTDVGHAMEDLMGHAYKSNYTKDDFKAKYFVFTNRRHFGYQKQDRERIRSENLKEDKETEHSVRIDLLNTARNSIISIFGGKHQEDGEDDEFSNMEDESLDFTFKYPYSELLIWAVLTKRQSMALLMWRHGEEAMAKALVACRLFESLANDASQNYLELEICEELKNNSEEFRKISIEALQYCTEQDKDITLQLLTYELTNWGNETCLSLAALNNNRQFLAHPWYVLISSETHNEKVTRQRAGSEKAPVPLSFQQVHGREQHLLPDESDDPKKTWTAVAKAKSIKVSAVSLARHATVRIERLRSL
ncbi:unnamed protein product [Nippostrongylus brasiliensis]|uniref:Transient receptor potential channel (inferred by orthology to a C. elegans protein) n=1 Tax=Nippostrongylus brasiliensis TaxID=27835 RepID=A0A0N4YZ21_NIPBR|nr:unnamed protein product [Nippostrongylus brasiliensis]